MPQIYRVAVRGRFDSLSDESRAGLAAAVEDHDVVTSGGFSDDGKLSYDRHLDFFAYRVQLRTDAEDGADDVTREGDPADSGRDRRVRGGCAGRQGHAHRHGRHVALGRAAPLIGPDAGIAGTGPVGRRRPLSRRTSREGSGTTVATMGEAVSDVDDPDVGRAARRRWSNPWPDQPLWVSVATWVGVLSPLVAAVIWASRHPFLPGRDRALMELQAMDVFTRDTPLVGVWSRLGWHHPGPWPVWIMAVPYRLLGPSHSLLLAAAIVNLGAVVVLVAVVRRAMPSWMGLVSCVVLLGVLHSFGGTGLADPWNPWITVVPALVASVAAALAFERFWFGLVAIAGAAFATQAHVGYLPVMGLTTLVALYWLIAPLVRRATRPSRTPLPRRRHRRRPAGGVGPGAARAGGARPREPHPDGRRHGRPPAAARHRRTADAPGDGRRGRRPRGPRVLAGRHLPGHPAPRFDDVASSRWWLLVPSGASPSGRRCGGRAPSRPAATSSCPGSSWG